MAIEIINAVIHGFEKEQHVKGVALDDIVYKDKCLDITLPTVIALVSGVAKLLGNRMNMQSWGRFNPTRGGKFYDYYSQNYLEVVREDKFLELSINAMDEIVEYAAKEPASTGSRILFALYKDDGNCLRLLIAMIKQRGGITLDKDYVPIGVVEVDMSKLSQAADIRCNEYIISVGEEQGDDGVEAEDVDNSEEGDLRNYLSFLSSKNASDASGYFIEALGCMLHVSPKKSTTAVINLTKEFFEKTDGLKPFAKAAKEAVVNYLKQQKQHDKSAKIEEIVHEISRIIPADLVFHIDELSGYYNNDKNRVPAEFFVHSGALDKWTRVVVTTEDMQLKFSKSVVGTDERSKVFYDRDKKRIIIKDLNERQIGQLEKQLG
ncbi:nucleoid-associated protein [Delftia sp. PE138]|uniref:nucleoid-associated protein n=1 Tax=Delftia sp. PE138 TaxID=1812483 RepID=UPI001BAF9BD1|nr:nucleoid-associated protein [Delftia sp. PE138]MBS3721868.1 Nucleoid-associated protein YejK [Delftia sp. PE138]